MLECLFTSDTPLTDTFLKKKNSYGVERIHKTLSPAFREDGEESKADQTITLNAYVRKKEGNIIYVECGEDFVDLLFTFLAMPLESVWGISGNGIILGCIGNLCKSFKELSVDPGTEASGFKCVLPHYYKCQKQLLDVVTTHKPPTYYRYVSFSVDHFREYRLSENSSKRLVYDWDKLVPVTSIDPKSEDNNTAESSGFVKRGTRFMVTDDLIITPSNTTSTIGMLKDKQTRLDEVEVRVINMTKEEVKACQRLFV